MDKITYATHTQTVYLKASKPPLFSDRDRTIHWAIASTNGVPHTTDQKENAAYLEALPARIVTVPLLHHTYRRHIMTILLLIWMFALCCRFRRSRKKMVKLRPSMHGLCVVSIAFFGYLDWLSPYILAVAATTALCGRPLDALASLAVLVWAREGWTLTSIGLTIAYANWAWKSLYTHLVPTFERFLARLRPVSFPAKLSEEAGGRGCLVCWTTNEVLLRLPCHNRHILCRSCLLQLHETDQCRCPHCRKTLYVYKSRRTRALIRYIVLTGVYITFAFRSIVLVLQLYKSHYREAIKYVVATFSFMPIAWYTLLRLPGESRLRRLHMWLLWLLLAVTAFSVWSSAAAVQIWDQATLWDGAVLQGVEVWDTHTVVKEHYAAVVRD